MNSGGHQGPGNGRVSGLARTRRRVRAVLGAFLIDRPLLAWPIWLPGCRALCRESPWATFHNRRERLIPNPSGRGFDCDWQWTSDLTIGRAVPAVSRRILREALREWPIELAHDRPKEGERAPDVSFVIGHRGRERLPLLLRTLQSLLGQRGCSIEIIVVEQAVRSVVSDLLPPGVRLVHQVPEDPGMPYSRSWAFNRGAEEARGRVLVLHDNDILAPSYYAAEVLALADRGFEAMRLQRFLFYIGSESTERLVRASGDDRMQVEDVGLESILQNCEGATIAVTREAYFRIGGHDEDFVGWGGEDNEFLDRCRLLRFHPWSYMPFLHLWHAPQPGKVNDDGRTEKLRRKMAVPREERALRLSRRLLTAIPVGVSSRPASMAARESTPAEKQGMDRNGEPVQGDVQ